MRTASGCSTPRMAATRRWILVAIDLIIESSPATTLVRVSQQVARAPAKVLSAQPRHSPSSLGLILEGLLPIRVQLQCHCQCLAVVGEAPTLAMLPHPRPCPANASKLSHLRRRTRRGPMAGDWISQWLASCNSRSSQRARGRKPPPFPHVVHPLCMHAYFASLQSAAARLTSCTGEATLTLAPDL